MRGVEGEQFVARLGNPAQFVVLELGRARPLIGTVGQVAGTVVAVAAFDGGLGVTRRYFGFPLPLSVRSLRVAICRFRRPKGQVRNGWRVYPGTIDFTACFPYDFSS